MSFEKYKLLYTDVCHKTVEVLTDDMGFSLENMSISLASTSDIKAACDWVGADYRGFQKWPPNGGWDWVRLDEGQKKKTKQFIVSFKVDNELVMMMRGGISKRKQVVSVQYLDTPPYPTNLNVNATTIAITFSAILADRVDAKYLAVYEPNAAFEKILRNDFGFSEESPFGNREEALYREII